MADIFVSSLEKMLTPSPKLTTTKSAAAKMKPTPPFVVGPMLQRNESGRKRDLGISEKALCYATALQLEKTGIKWEMAQGWTTYLFSAGPSGNIAVREKYQLIKEADTELDALIKQVLDEETAYWANWEKDLLPCRLLLWNIAAGAVAEDIALFLSEFKYDM
jgi:hypothetical protein